MNCFPEKKITRAERQELKARVMGLSLPPNYAELVVLQLPHLDTPQGQRLIYRVRNLHAINVAITQALENINREVALLRQRLSTAVLVA